jgi:hypothetical protein
LLIVFIDLENRAAEKLKDNEIENHTDANDRILQSQILGPLIPHPPVKCEKHYE